MSKRTKRSLVLAILSAGMLSVFALTVVGISCSSDPGPGTVDVGVDKGTTPKKDLGKTPDQGKIPDTGAKKDQYVWPDVSKPKDAWPTPADGYAGTPFGCESDADCFGKQCCPTPWGVKLCAVQCN